MLMSVWMAKTAPVSFAALMTVAQVPGVKTGCMCGFPRLIRTHEYFSQLLLAFSIWSTGQVTCTYKNNTSYTRCDWGLTSASIL